MNPIPWRIRRLLTPSHYKIWGTHVLEVWKPHSLAKFDKCSDLYEHVASINTQMAIIGALDSLKCKLLSITFRDDVMWLYMVIPRASIACYQELVNKLVHQFTSIPHKKCLPLVCSSYARVHQSRWVITSPNLLKPPSRLSHQTKKCLLGSSKMDS